MSRFARPADAIASPAALVPGLIIWHVYGIWPPSMGQTPQMVVAAPVKYADHHSRTGTDTYLADKLVCDTLHLKADLTPDTMYDGKAYNGMFFLADGNIGDTSYNDNYYFDNREDAEAAVAYLYQCYRDDPKSVDDEKARRSSWQAYDFMSYDHHDDYPTLDDYFHDTVTE